jgi:hypothetical protein
MADLTVTLEEWQLKDELRALQNKLGYTGTAAELGVSENLIRDVLRGKLPIGPKLAAALGCTHEVKRTAVRLYKRKL